MSVTTPWTTGAASNSVNRFLNQHPIEIYFLQEQKIFIYLQSNSRGRVEIGRQARLRIWCREAYGFDSLRPHKKREPSLVLFFCAGECPPFHVTPSLNPFPRGRDFCFQLSLKTCGRRESPISQPLSLRDIPFQGNTDHSLWSGRAAPLLQLSAKVSLTRMPWR